MNVSLSVLDRLMFINSLPSEESIVTLRMVRKLKEQVGFTDEELSALKFDSETKPGQLLWVKEAVGEREFDLSDKAVEVITAGLKRLNDSKKMTESHLGLYDKIVKDAV